MNIIAPIPALQKRIKELEEEVLRLRQQRDAANAQLAFVLEKLPEEYRKGPVWGLITSYAIPPMSRMSLLFLKMCPHCS